MVMSLSPETLKQYSVEYDTDEVVFWEGDAAKYFYIILKGRVEIQRRKPDGEHMVLATLEKGGFFGEMALMTSLPRSATAIAKKPCTLLAIDRLQLQKVLAMDPEFAVKMIQILCERLRNLGDALVQV